VSEGERWLFLFVDIDGIDDQHCLKFFFTIEWKFGWLFETFHNISNLEIFRPTYLPTH
jgi:hypothetical protein